MSSKWSSTSSYLTDTTPAWTPHERPKDVLKVILYKFLFVLTLFEHPMDEQDMSSKWSSTPIWTHPMDVQNMSSKLIVLPVPIWLTQHLFEHPMDVQKMSSKWSSIFSYLAEPTLFEHHKDVQNMSSKWSPTSSYLTDTTSVWTPHGRQKMSSKCSSTCSYLTNTKPIWTPQGHGKDVLKGIVYQFLFDWHNTCLNTPWTSKRCHQSDPLQVPIWVS